MKIRRDTHNPIIYCGRLSGRVTRCERFAYIYSKDVKSNPAFIYLYTWGRNCVQKSLYRVNCVPTIVNRYTDCVPKMLNRNSNFGPTVRILFPDKTSWRSGKFTGSVGIVDDPGMMYTAIRMYRAYVAVLVLPWWSEQINQPICYLSLFRSLCYDCVPRPRL